MSQLLLAVALMAAALGYTFYMKRKMAAGMPAAFRMFFERTGYRYADILASSDAPALGDLALTSVVGRTHFEHRASVVATSAEEMRLALKTISPESAGGCMARSTAAPRPPRASPTSTPAAIAATSHTLRRGMATAPRPA